MQRLEGTRIRLLLVEQFPSRAVKTTVEEAIVVWKDFLGGAVIDGGGRAEELCHFQARLANLTVLLSNGPSGP